MAGSVYVDANFKSAEGNTVVLGRVLVGNADVLRADEFGLSVIQSIIFQPYGDTPVGSITVAKLIHMQGSLGSVDNKGSSNYVSVRSWALKNYHGDNGTLVLGTEAGSIRASYIAVGY